MTRAGVLALLACAGVRALFAAFPDLWMTVPACDFDYINWVASQHRVKALPNPSPRVVIISTFRVFPLSASEVATPLGMDASEVGLFPFIGGTFWAENDVVRRHPELPAKAEVVVLEGLPSSLFESPSRAQDRVGVLRFASTYEKLHIQDPAARLRATCDMLFPAWSLQNTVLPWRVFLQTLGRPRDEVWEEYRDLALALQRGDPLVLTNEAFMIGYAPYPEESDTGRRALGELLARFPSGCKIVLLSLPLRSDYQAAVAENPTFNASFSEFRRTLEGFAGPRISVEWLDDEAAAGLCDQDFDDVCHFKPQAVRTKVCRLLVDIVRRNLPKG